MLVSAIENMKQGLVWQHLLSRGMTEQKLIYEWKKKSYFLKGKADLVRKEYESAIEHLEHALKLSTTSPTGALDDAKLRELLQQAITKRTAEKKKEKNTWSKAFDKIKEESEGAATATGFGTGSPPSSGSGSGVVKLSHLGSFVDRVLGTNSSGNSNSNSNNDSSNSSDGLDKGLFSVEKGGEKSRAGTVRPPQSDNSGSKESVGWVVGLGVAACVVTTATYLFLKSRKSR